MKTIITLVLIFCASISFAAGGAFQISNNKLSFPDGSEFSSAPKDGKTILSGSGAPTDVTAQPGDYYIDTTNHKLYGPYIGSWPAGVSLIGPVGLQGSTGLQGPSGPQGPANLIPWVAVSGIGQNADMNTGYITTNSSLTTITMPSSPLVGTIFRIAGPGAGGWKLALNSGQFITSGSDYALSPLGFNWLQHESQRNWGALASSNDGVKLVTAIYGGPVYSSTDSGTSWTPHDVVPGEGVVNGRRLNSVASSSDGTKLIAAFSYLYTSTDSGVTWTRREIVPAEGSVNRNWQSAASSSDGTKLVVAVNGGLLYTSADSGVTWARREIVLAEGSVIRNWNSVASSSDGTKLVALSLYRQIYTSTDSGATWTNRNLSPVVNEGDLSSVSCSGDGSKFVVLSKVDVAPNDQGFIYVSTDNGATWTVQSTAGYRRWVAVAFSGDGTKLAASSYADQIYTASTLSMAEFGQTLYGSKSSAIELLYVGNGQYTLLSQQGNINWKPF